MAIKCLHREHAPEINYVRFWRELKRRTPQNLADHARIRFQYKPGTPLKSIIATALPLRIEKRGTKRRLVYLPRSAIDGTDVAATLDTVIESCKKIGLDPWEYLKYVITERWHGRDPKSPMKLSLERFGRNQKIIYPAKDQWRVFPASA